MLETVLRHLKNWFLVPNGVHTGTFVVEGGCIALPFLQNGQYYRIIGSVYNDGLHKYGDESFENVLFGGSPLQKETFTGAVWALAVPKAVEDLAAEISEWSKKNESKVNSPFQSESFENYSYTKLTGSNGRAVSWENTFRNRLNPYRKAREI